MESPPDVQRWSSEVVSCGARKLITRGAEEDSFLFGFVFFSLRDVPRFSETFKKLQVQG